VQARMQAAMDDWLGHPVEWQHAAVHRWRFAMPLASGATPAPSCWWDADRGLGVCGDFLGGKGVEGAWQSAQALIKAISLGVATASASTVGPPTDRPGQRVAA
jgi:renalase